MKTIQFFSFFLALSFLTLNTVSCQNWYKDGMKGEGPKVTEEFDLAAFDALSLTISGDVYLRQGSQQSVKIEAQQNILDNLSREVEGKTWKIKFDKNVKNHDGVKIWVTVPTLRSALLSGSGNIEGENKFTGLSGLELVVSGSGDIELAFEAKSVDVAISGSGGVEMEGQVGDCDIKISGSGGVEANDLITENCSVKISGSGDATVHANGSLDVGIAGSGDVVYAGSPRVKSKISGSGEVTAK